MNNEIAIRADNVSKSFLIPHENRNTIREQLLRFRKKTTYETFDALKDISFEVLKGEFFSIIGRNGSGKSTLLKILAGIYTADKGGVKVDGEISPFLELGVGFNPELSGKDNIYLNSTILGLQKHEIDRKYKSIVDFSELDQFIDLKLKNYSSGMQVRLAFSTAIHTNREILLMDEVLAVGDARFQVKCFSIFEKIIKSGRTIVFVSHDPIAIEKYSNRVLYLENGEISYLGSPVEALSKYMYTDAMKESQSEQVDEARGVLDETLSDITEETEEFLPINPVSSPDIEHQQDIIEIESIRFFDQENNETNLLKNGEKFRIDVEYNLSKTMENLIYGITIRNHFHHDMFITNTEADNISSGKRMPGKVLISYEIMNYFGPGKYTVSAIVRDHTKRIFYNWKDDFVAFQVHNPTKLISFQGMDLPHSTSINDQNNPG